MGQRGGGGLRVMPETGCDGSKEKHVSNEKNHGWLGYIGHYTPQLYRH